MSNASVLDTLLTQCKSLHTGLLSLEQLATVHETLLKCSAPVSTTLDCSGLDSSSDLGAIIQLRCQDSPQDISLCRDVLIDASSQTQYTDEVRLLVIQFLMAPLTLRDALQHVLIPFLNQPQAENEEATSTSTDFEIALLKLVNGNLDAGDQAWSSILESLVNSASPVLGRILVQLVRLQPSSAPLVQALYKKVWQTLQDALSSPPVLSANQITFQDHPVLATLSKDLLPLLTSATNGTPAMLSDLHRPHLNELWTKLLSLFIEKSTPTASRDETRNTLLSITTVLCPLLPHLVEVELPTVDSKVSDSIPANQPCLWELMYLCLSQGKSVLEDGLPLSSILRRRGLFLLGTVVTSPEWHQYVMCFETLEMEHEQHLVDQIWDSLGGLFGSVQKSSSDFKASSSLTWEWMSLLFGCVLSSELPVIRKMGMYRILKVQEAARLVASGQAPQVTNKKRKQKAKPIKASSICVLEKMPPDFVLQILLPSWNSLAKTVGFMMHIELQNRKLEREDMVPLMRRVIKDYVAGLDMERATAFWSGLWDWELLRHFNTKSVVLIFQSLSERLSEDASMVVPVDNHALALLAKSIEAFFVTNSVVLAHRKDVLDAVANILAHSQVPPNDTAGRWSPMAVLHVLVLYDKEYFPLELEDWSVDNDRMLVNLAKGISQLGTNVTAVAATLATAFVDGNVATRNSEWDPENGATTNETGLSWAILLFASIVGIAGQGSKTSPCSQLVWPAINKGLANSAGAILTQQHLKADHVSRALLLLEAGCLLRQVSGMGNGDLVLDKSTQQMMPPPPNVEKMLSSAVDFILFHIKSLLSIDSNEAANGAKQTSKTYVKLVTLLRTLHQSFPSSQVISSTMNTLLNESSAALKGEDLDDNKKVLHTTMIYGALSAGVTPEKDLFMSLCESIIGLVLKGDTRDKSNTWEHMARSILFYAKWASISKLIPKLVDFLQDASDEYMLKARNFVRWILDEAFEAVPAAAQDGVVPVFNSVLGAGKIWIDVFNYDKSEGETYVDTLHKLTRSLLDLMRESSSSFDGVYMLNELCSLIFQPVLMSDEYDRFVENENSDLPIRSAFRELLKFAGAERAHVSRSVLCRVAVGWLGINHNDKSTLGLSAIPYKDDIVELLVHKGVRKSESASNQHRDQIRGGMEIPAGTNDLSLSRAFVLVFLSKLPDQSDGLSPVVLTELIEPVIEKLLQKAEPVKSQKRSLVMIGTPEYCIKMRSWQALCVLCRFVSTRIASRVCKTTFLCIQETIHSQIRYFVEIFAIKCGSIHPKTFGAYFINEISRTDLALQQVASLMIMGGNWIVGRHKLEFFEPSAENNLKLRRVLVGAIPWLSSTQGFSRAIAQLIVFAIIPLVLDVNTKPDMKSLSGDSDWVLYIIYSFLNENLEMVRLRKKQMKFFDAYDVDEVCTPEGVLAIPVDEGDEANPAHLVDAMKRTLIEVYEEAHGAEAPNWKQVEELIEAQPKSTEKLDNDDKASEANFQRKIIPLDALNLAMESQREIKLRNAAGQQKQQLIVCASLIDKIPNLGGLARTSEIFSADRLIIPDKSVCVMDNFKNISVGAGDWIDIEEVRPEALLNWLLEYKAKGYFVFGLEQTASSVSLDEMVFPDRPTILLLGKEKEGIPVELLQAVDQCVEIPQLGIIRSLNVHVSGAIAIWEHTKQRRLKGGK